MTPTNSDQRAIDGEVYNASSLRATSGDQVDLRWILAAFQRRLGLFIGVAAIIFLFGLIFTLTQVKQYTATSSVMIDSRQLQLFANSSTTAANQSVVSGPSTENSAVETEVEVLKSRKLADEVSQSLDLDHDPDFMIQANKKHGPGIIGSVKSALGLGQPAIPLTPAERASIQHNLVIDELLADLDVQENGLTYVMSISVTTPSRIKAAAIANKYAELYVSDSLNKKIGATHQAAELIGGRLNDLAAQADSDSAALQRYKIDHNLMSSSGSTLTEQEIAGLDQQLASARAEAAEDQARLVTAREQVQNGSNGEDVGEALNSPVIQSLRAQRVQVSGQLADFQGRYGPNHPDLLKAKRQLSDLDAQIHAEIARDLSNLQAKAEISRDHAQSLQASLDKARGGLVDNNRATVGLDALQQKADASKAMYDQYLDRAKGLSTQQGTEQSDAALVSSAEIPVAPSQPKVVLLSALSLLAGIGIGFLVVFAATAIDAGLTTAAEIEKRLGIAYLGGIPDLKSVTHLWKQGAPSFVISHPLSISAESFRNFRSALEYDTGVSPKVVALVSALSGEGKTTTAVCLAHIAAQQGLRVVLVDCDVRRRTVARVLKISPEIGLIEVLAGGATVQQALYTDPETGASFLPLSANSLTPKDLMGGEAMARVLSELRASFDLVILDTAPLLAIADGRSLAAKSDAVVVLARWRKTPEHAIRAALRFLNGPDVLVAGMVLTRVDMRKQSKYGYGDPGFYFDEYKNYFNEPS